MQKSTAEGSYDRYKIFGLTRKKKVCSFREGKRADELIKLYMQRWNDCHISQNFK